MLLNIPSILHRAWLRGNLQIGNLAGKGSAVLGVGGSSPVKPLHVPSKCGRCPVPGLPWQPRTSCQGPPRTQKPREVFTTVGMVPGTVLLMLRKPMSHGGQ